MAAESRIRQRESGLGTKQKNVEPAKQIQLEQIGVIKEVEKRLVHVEELISNKLTLVRDSGEIY